MTALPLTSLVTLLVILLMFATAINVGRARQRYGIQAPAVLGHEMFERAYRIQMNTLESAGLIGDRGAGLTGIIWLCARVWYAIAYQSNPSKREGGFILSFLAFAGLWLGALWGVVRVMPLG